MIYVMQVAFISAGTFLEYDLLYTRSFVTLNPSVPFHPDINCLSSLELRSVFEIWSLWHFKVNRRRSTNQRRELIILLSKVK